MVKSHRGQTLHFKVFGKNLVSKQCEIEELEFLNYTRRVMPVVYKSQAQILNLGKFLRISELSV